MVRLLTQAEIHEWRMQSAARLRAHDGHRRIYHSSEATDKSLEPVETVGETPVFDAPAKLEPRSGREAAEIVANDLYRWWRYLETHDPEAFRRKVEELRAATGSQYAMWSDEQLADNIMSVLRSAVAEPLVQKVYTQQGRGGGYREVPVS